MQYARNIPPQNIPAIIVPSVSIVFLYLISKACGLLNLSLSEVTSLAEGLYFKFVPPNDSEILSCIYGYYHGTFSLLHYA